MTLRFSNDLPSNCPLPNAIDCNAEVFVVVKQNPLVASDFKTQADKGTALNVTGDAACQRHGLSVFPDLSSCEHQKGVFPHLGPHIASAQLTPNHGKILKTPSRNNPVHHTWWPYAGVQRHELFSIVKDT